MRSLVLSCAFVTLAALAAGACGPGSAPLTACPGSGGAGGTGNSSSRTRLTHNDCPHNSLDPFSLRFNQRLRQKLTTIQLNSNALRQAVEYDVPPAGDFSLGAQLADPLTQDLMQYIVSCALKDSPDRDVLVPVGPAPVGGFPETPGDLPGDPDGWNSPGPWHGELGLCDEWATSVPETTCLERVSACVLARVNALNKKVIISVRGPSGGAAGSEELFPLQQKVAVETEYRDRATGTSMPLVPIHSLDTCASPNPDPTRNCGWTPLYIGRCTADANVTLTPQVCGDQQQPMLRVCRGLYGCDDPNGTPASAAPPYAGFIPGASAAAGSAVQFPCPVNGPLVGADQSGPRYGYFSVMAAFPDSLSPDDRAGAQVELVATSGAPVEYPAPEVDVFTYREGAFYGNIFSSMGTGKTVLSDGLFACYGDSWGCGLAHLTDRFCAGAGAFQCSDPNSSTEVENCFDQNVPNPCLGENGQVCQADDGSPGGYYEDCMGWSSPITVYLNHPCDLSPDGNCHGNPLLAASSWLAANVTTPLPSIVFNTETNCFPSPPKIIAGTATGGYPPYTYAWTVTILNTDRTTRAGPMTISNQASTSTGSIPANWFFVNLDPISSQSVSGEPIVFEFTVTDSGGAQATASETVNWVCAPQ